MSVLTDNFGFLDDCAAIVVNAEVTTRVIVCTAEGRVGVSVVDVLVDAGDLGRLNNAAIGVKSSITEVGARLAVAVSALSVSVANELLGSTDGGADDGTDNTGLPV